MPVTMTSEAYGVLPGATFTGTAAEEAWLLAHGYASKASYTGVGVSNTGATDVLPAGDPTLAVNREDPGDAYQFGKDDALAPRVYSITPAKGPAVGGTVVLIKGDNMVDATGVTFGGTAGTAFKVVDDNTVQVTVPQHAAGAEDVVVTDATGSTTVTDGYAFEALTIVSLDPDTGPADTVVTITGTNLDGVTGVTFGGVAGTALELVDTNTIKVTTGAHADGAVDVVATDPTGTATLTGGFTYAA